MLALWRVRNRSSADVKRLALSHVGMLEHKMRELKEMAATLRHLADNCHGDDRPDCPIIGELAHGSGADDRRPGKPRKTGRGFAFLR